TRGRACWSAAPRTRRRRRERRRPERTGRLRPRPGGNRSCRPARRGARRGGAVRRHLTVDREISMKKHLRTSLVLLAGAALAACGDDGDGPTGPSRAEVAGIYSICQLTFTPAGTLGSVNLLDVAFETENT